MNFGKRSAQPAIVQPEQQRRAMGIIKADEDRALKDAELTASYKQTNDDPLQVGGPIPQSIGRVADLYSDVRQLRLGMEKEVEAVKARETQLRDHIINNLSKSDDTGAAGLRYRAQIVMKDVPRAADWGQIHAYIQKTGRFDLVQRRLGEAAIKEMWASKEEIPGVEKARIPDVSITKI